MAPSECHIMMKSVITNYALTCQKALFKLLVRLKPIKTTSSERYIKWRMNE